MKGRHWYGVALALCLLAGCGGSGGDGSKGGTQAQSGEEEQITQVIDEAFTSGDPSKCTTLYTQGFLEQASGVKGDDAVKRCERTAKLDNATSVEVSNLSASDSTAAVDVAVTGSELDGQTLAVRLISDSGAWKIDRLTGFVSFDRDALIAGVTNSLREVGLPGAARTCVVTRFKGLSDQDMQNVYLSDDKTQLNQILTSCSQKDSLQRVS